MSRDLRGGALRQAAWSALALGLLWPTTLRADVVDELVRVELSRRQIPGLSLAIVRDGQVVKAEGYGFANVEHRVPARPDTVYQSGSVGKQFTAAAVLMLVEDGKLRLDDPLLLYFADAPKSWRSITIRQLLTHTSGIKDWENADLDYRRDYSEEELVKVAHGLPIEFVPGTQWSYSNTGYVLLGFVVRKASGQFYGDFLRQRVFEPLGMSATRVISEADIVPNRAAGYRLVKGVLQNQEWVSPSLNTTADGSLYTTVLDLAKWDAALLGERVLKRASRDAWWTPVALAGGADHPYGFGWSLDEQRGHRLIEHGGSWQGFRSAIARYVDDKLTVIALANLAQAEPETVVHLAAGLVEPALAPPDPRRPAQDPDPARTARLRDVLAAWAAGAASPDMAPALKGTASHSARESADRKRTGERLAQARSLSFLAEDDVAARGMRRRGETVARVVHLGLVAEDAAWHYRFFLTPSGAVADFSVEER